MMDLNEYQRSAQKYATYRVGTPTEDNGLLYCALKLGGEAGEVLEKIGKALRGDYTLVSKREEIAKELGDVLWYISQMARELGYTLDEVALMNLTKLDSRKARGTLLGNGDNR